MKPIFQYQLSILILVLCAFISCETKNEENEKRYAKIEKVSSQDKLVNFDDFAGNYKVSLIDSIGDEIQRVFVVMDSINIDVMQNSICEIIENYQLTERSSISIFTDEKYANYKDKIFFLIDDDPLKDVTDYLPITEYENWRNDYYLAESNLKSKELVLFPSNGEKKKNVGIIDCEKD